jgi:hypothetical protein
METSTISSQVDCTGQLEALPDIKHLRKIHSKTGEAITVGTGHVNSSISDNKETAKGSSLAPHDGTGHVSPQPPGPEAVRQGGQFMPHDGTGHVTPEPPGPNAMVRGGRATPHDGTGHVTPQPPGPEALAASASFPSIGDIVSSGHVKTPAQLAFQLYAATGHKLPKNLGLQIIDAHQNVLFQTEMTSFDDHSHSELVVALDAAAAKEAEKFFATNNHLLIVAKTAKEQKQIQSVSLAKHSN